MLVELRMKTARRAPGFSLLELMFVIIIIGVLASVVGYNLLGAADRAKQSATLTSMDIVKKALNTYRATYNVYPDVQSGLQVLVTDKLIEKFPKDGWQRDLEYYSPTPSFPNGFELISAGPDMVSGTADDIRVTPDAQ
ncbi:MAG: type II secretion system protein GspG [Phycisphaerae bacterium]|nr:type II secretion system protein GspG [Phycisphaerae bacterium]